jgi:CPA1 family monovalent cation:H+ antiporter
VLGAIVSPPDAVAAVAVMRRLGVPQRLVTILEGEGLVNDAGALVAYRLAVTAAVSAAGEFSFARAGLHFAFAASGGVAIGLGVGWLIAAVRRRIGGQPLVENTLSLITPFVAFIPAEQAGTSGVLAVVTTGLYLGRLGPRIVSPATRLQAQAMWDMIVFTLEGLSFILIGLYLPISSAALREHTWRDLARYAVWISGILIGLRLVWMLMIIYLPRMCAPFLDGKLPRPPWKEAVFVGWAGMRGGDSLVIALAIPTLTMAGLPFPARDLIVFLTFFVILVTLVVQGLTFGAAVRILGLRGDGEEDREELVARRASMEAGLAYLEEASKRGDDAPEHVEELRDRHARRLHHWISKDETLFPSKRKSMKAYRRLRKEMLEAERRALVLLRDQGVISDLVMTTVQRDMDFEAMLLDAEEARQTPGKEEPGKKAPD